MARDVTDTAPLESREAMIGWFEQGCKPPEAFRVGTEHEKIPFYTNDLSPVPYEGRRGDDGIRALLDGLGARTGWRPIIEADNVIGLHDEQGGGAISLEPGGQFELSGAPVETIHAVAAEWDQHLADVKAAAEPHDIGFLSLGMSPLWSREQTPMMPKGRYRLMRAYMPKVGSRGLDMMFRTCTIQANLDFSSEADMVKKLRVSLALQPIATALFANSPFTDGRPNGFLSARSEVWRDTDNQRAGMLDFAFEAGMGFERYTDYALQVPMYFLKRRDGYLDVTGARFTDLVAGRLPAQPGERATLSDWANHLSTIFPEVRLKRFLEMRGADMGDGTAVAALPAFFVGLLYDSAALDGAWELVRHWTASERQALRDDVPRLGFTAVVAGRAVRDIAADVLTLAEAGLRRRERRDALGRDETGYLAPLFDRVDRGRTAAEEWLERYRGAWGEDIRPVFVEGRL